MRLAFSFRRSAGLLAAATVGLSTAVVGVPGVAQAAIPSWVVSGSGASAPVPAGICAIEWHLNGGGAGIDSDGSLGSNAGKVDVVLPATEGEVYTLYPGGRGGSASGLTPGAGGVSGDSDPDIQGKNGTADPQRAGAGGGAASTVVLDGTTILQAYGADAENGYGLGGAGGGGGVNFAVDAPDWFDDSDSENVPEGWITASGHPCAPSGPSLNGAEGKDRALELDFTTMDDGDVPTAGYEYTKDGGATWLPLSGITERDGRSSATVGGLVNGTEYAIAIRAVSATGVPSHPSSPVTGTPHKRATAPAKVTVVAGEASLTVHWRASTAGTSPITGYAVDLVWSNGESGGGSRFCRTGPTVLTCTAPAQPGVTHDVVVYALEGGDQQGEWARTTSDVVPASSVLPKSDGALTRPAGSTASVDAGKKITVSGSGYAPFSTVTVLIYSTPQVLTTVVTDATGSFSLEVTVPAGLAAGQHNLVAAGVDPTGAMRYMTLPVTVTATVTGGTVATGPQLAFSGADVVVPTIGGVLAVLVGAALLFVGRRRPAN